MVSDSQPMAHSSNPSSSSQFSGLDAPFIRPGHSLPPPPPPGFINILPPPLQPSSSSSTPTMFYTFPRPSPPPPPQRPPPPPPPPGFQSTNSSPFNPISLTSQPQFDPITPINTPTPIKLSSANFLTWQAQILPIIHGYNLTQFLTSPSPNPTSVNSDGQVEYNREYLLWHRQDQLLLGWLRSSLSESIQAQVVSCTTTSSLWSTLHCQFASTSRAKLIDLKRQLQTIRKDGSSCSEFLQNIRRIADELAFVGAPMSDDDLVLTTLNGLGSDYNSFVAAITATSRNEVLSFADLQGLLLSHESLLRSQTISTAPAAFVSFAPNGSAKGGAQNFKRQFSNNRHPNQPHLRPVFQPQGAIGFHPNYNPHQRHGTDSSMSSQSKAQPQSNHQSSSQSDKTGLCQICKKPGHSAKNCKYRYTPDATYQPRSHPYQAYVAQPSNAPNSADWIIDSGASHHVTNDVNNLSSFFNYDGSDTLQIGDGSGLPIHHIGTTSLLLSNYMIHLKDTLHVANFSRNLISLSKLLSDNPSLMVSFSNSSCFLKDHLTNKTILEFSSSNGLYYLTASCNFPPKAFVGIRASANLWHHRLGHPSTFITLQVVKNFDLPCNSYKVDTCHNCFLGKAHRLPFAASNSSTSSPLELIHSDVWGPTPIVSRNGFRYYVLFVDDYSRFCWIYFMMNKSDVSTIFTKFKAQVENLFSTNIKVLRTDGGAEFKPISTLFPQIIHQTTCPHTPQQNGVSERKHRHIIELALSIMSYASLPTNFWDEIFSSVAYLINRLPNSNKLIPYTVLFNKQPDYSLLRILGCTCFPYTRPYNAHKLEFRSQPCVFVGYSTTQKGYRCLHLASNKIYVSRHVQFDEASFPFKQQQLHSSTVSQDHTQSTSSMLSVINPSLPLFTAGYNLNHVIGTPPVSAYHHNQQTSTAAHAQPVVNEVADPSTDRVQLSASASEQMNTPVLHSPNPLNSAASSLPSSTQSDSSSGSDAPSSNQPPNPTNTHAMTTRTRDNTRKPRHFTDFVAFHSTLDKEPTTFAKASPHLEWRQAMMNEIDALAANHTWTLVPSPPDQKVIGCKWVYKIKRRSDGTIERYKARLVAKGFNQQEGVDYFDTFSPVVRPTTIRVVLSLAVHHHWLVRQLDVQNAFLHGDLQERVYMAQPPGFVDEAHPNHVCLLSKSLYGLKQSPRAWFHKLCSTLLDIGFCESQYDPSLFISHHDNQLTIILVYVDDILITGSSSILISKYINHLHDKFALKDLGLVHFFLGIEVSSCAAGLVLSQSKYIMDILSKANMTNARPCDTPMASGVQLSKNDGELFDNPKLYRSIVGALQYATLTRPDISFAVNRVSQYMHNPTVPQWMAVKRILRYLCGSLNLKLHLNSSSSLNIDAYCDADWAGCPDDRRSTTGFSIFLGGNLVSWSAKKQTTVSRSSTEAEYRSLALTCAEILWLQYLLHELRVFPVDPPTLWCDNIGATFLASNPIFHARTKHIEIDYHFVRERIARKQLRVQFLCSKDQIADILTKPLASQRFSNLRHKLSVLPSASACGGGGVIIIVM
ncbi:hypothetical protein LUZ63_017448 [Rhynchospora breviuscula]|uniref:Integrase catalytic domain-containing protein n=1 Tax=Rhynchospora breviuscula TaxID=2022672 RepID=A0A9Q0C2H2_9POAL|nr:hypothetical protein LUZ63_017448 [Rhynchospora breviuscula]